jgi:hypothetical protein
MVSAYRYNHYAGFFEKYNRAIDERHFFLMNDTFGENS